MRIYSVATRLFGALCLSAANAVAETCTPPPYFVAVDAPALSDAPGLMQVSLPRGKFTLENLVCLVRTLKKEHASHQGLDDPHLRFAVRR